MDLSKLLNNRDKTVLVIGDIMLDVYVYGHSQRISPEAPVPVFVPQTTEKRPGGAANVAKQITDLGFKCRLLGFCMSGDEINFMHMMGRNEYNEFLLDIGGIISEGKTISKQRLMVNGRQIMRIDHNDKQDYYSHDQLSLMFDYGFNRDDTYGAVVIADYKKGTITDELAKYIIAKCNDLNIPVFVDTKRQDVSCFYGATAITPNEEEYWAIKGHIHKQPLKQQKIFENAFKYIVQTQGSVGVDLYFTGRRGGVMPFPSKARRVYDVTGAGDVMIATIAAATSAGYMMQEAVELANIAAGLSVEQIGTSTISFDELYVRACDPINKILTPYQIKKIIGKYKRIVLTNGCFDVLHVGHMGVMQHAKKYGDVLVVAVNSDESLKRIKDRNPIFSLEERMNMIASLPFVDFVTDFHEDTPLDIMNIIEPKVVVKGHDYKRHLVVANKGATKIIAPKVYDITSSQIIKSVVAKAENGGIWQDAKKTTRRSNGTRGKGVRVRGRDTKRSCSSK